MNEGNLSKKTIGADNDINMYTGEKKKEKKN